MPPSLLTIRGAAVEPLLSRAYNLLGLAGSMTILYMRLDVAADLSGSPERHVAVAPDCAFLVTQGTVPVSTSAAVFESDGATASTSTLLLLFGFGGRTPTKCCPRPKFD